MQTPCPSCWRPNERRAGFVTVVVAGAIHHIPRVWLQAQATVLERMTPSRAALDIYHEAIASWVDQCGLAGDFTGEETQS